MRFTNLMWLFANLAICIVLAEADPTAAVRRQVDGIATPTSLDGDSQPPPSSILSSASTKRPESDTSSRSEKEPATSDSPSLDDRTTAGQDEATATSAANDNLPTSAPRSDEARSEPDPLPLSPQITPAFGVAGVFLILAGLVYALIGIKNRWVQVFLSSAFLASLSVTVLLIYVLRPPVPPAIQGAYLVAAFMTGAIIGAAAIVFRDLTEGVGCLLGGFCLSMWLLSLQPGGTLQSTTSKAIFIAAFALAAYAPSFHHRTRPHSLIGATSFAGATAVVLGVDCFTKAGLKEFWVYIWKLNDDIFPLDTKTYPITRGIRVELGVTVVLCLLGVMSQLRLWKTVKNRRQTRQSLRKEQEKERDHLEEAIGRRLEQDNERDLDQWEAMYGEPNKRKGDSNLSANIDDEDGDDSRKPSVKVKEIRLDDLPSGAVQTNGDPRSSRGDTPQTVPADSFDKPAHRSIPSLDGKAIDLEGSANLDMRPGTACPGDSSLSSVAAIFHGDSDGRRLVGDGSQPLEADKPEPSPETGITENAASIVVHDKHYLSQTGEADRSAHDLPTASLHSVSDELDPEEFKRPVQVVSGSTLPQSALSTRRSQDPAQEKGRILDSHVNSAPFQAEIPSTTPFVPKPDRQSSVGAASNPRSLTHEALDRQPGLLSHGVLAHRTNEWAKHNSPADHPDLDELEVLSEGSGQEVAAPPDIQEMRSVQSPTHPSLIAAPLKVSPACSPPASETAQSLSSGQDLYNTVESPVLGVQGSPLPSSMTRLSKTPQKQVNPDIAGLQRSLSSPPLSGSPSHSLRNSWSPVPGQTLMTSPIDENAETEFPAQLPSRPFASPLVAPGSTFLAQRDSFLRSKRAQANVRDTMPSTDVSLSRAMAGSVSRSSLMDVAGQRSASRLSDRDGTAFDPPQRSISYGYSSAPHDDDDIPLSQRKAMIQRQQQQQEGFLSDSQDKLGSSNFDAHLPQRSSSSMTLQKRASLLATWRESMHKEAGSNLMPQRTTETPRAKMMMQKQSAMRSQQILKMSKSPQKNAASDPVIWSGGMQNLHREAMRKMQASANRHVS